VEGPFETVTVTLVPPAPVCPLGIGGDHLALRLVGRCELLHDDEIEAFERTLRICDGVATTFGIETSSVLGDVEPHLRAGEDLSPGFPPSPTTVLAPRGVEIAHIGC